MKQFRSHARWADEVYTDENGEHISTDDHDTEEQANAVCNSLLREGFGGWRKDFPVETWVTPISFEEQYPEEAETLAELCEERAEAKARGDKIKPIFLDAEGDSLYPQPIRVSEKIGRNDLCPCGSGKKYKKCCLNKG